MTELVGPVYVAHPHWGETEEERASNVTRAASLSSAVNQLGCATISPLQESKGRELALSEDVWKQHDLVLLRASLAVAIPTYWEESNGCVAGVALAVRLGIPVFQFVWSPMWAMVVDSAWVAPGDFTRWVERERAKLLDPGAEP